MNHKRNFLLFLNLFFIIHFTTLCCCTKTKSAEYQEIGVDSLKTIIDSNENFLIIDVRTQEEYVGNLGHIKGSILRPVQEIEDWYKEFLEYQNKTIYLVCRSGNRSGRATRFLLEHGFTRVANLAGGMLAWNNKEYPIEKGEIKEILKELTQPKGRKGE
jgi:rhodanese-related sulfurtransferase